MARARDAARVASTLLLASLTLTACQQGKVDHVLVLTDSKSAQIETALGVMAKHGVAADVARPLLVAVSEKGEGIVVQGTKDACERIKASFEAIGMQSNVRPITAEDRKGPPSEFRDSDVVELEGVKELEQLMASNEGCLLAFHGTTCAHCRAMAPDYKQVATSLKGSLKVAAVNLNSLERSDAQALADQLGIVALPTVRFVRAGSHLEYSGPRTAAAIQQFAERAMKPVEEAADGKGGAAEPAEAAGSKNAATAEAKASEEVAEAAVAAKAEAKEPAAKPASKIGQSKVQAAAAAATAA